MQFTAARASIAVMRMLVVAHLMTSIQCTYLIWLRMFAVAQEYWKSEVGLAITANNVGKTRITNFWFIVAVMARKYVFAE
jgi:hypothetical protein